MRKVWFLFIIAILVVACAPKEPTVVPEVDLIVEETPAEPMAEAEPMPAETAPAEPEQPKIEAVREITMAARRFEFEPSTIEVNKGETVRITVTSEDVTHGFAISEYGIRKKIYPGVPVTIEFVADKVGEFTYYCSVPCGMGHGSMRGKLIVR